MDEFEMFKRLLEYASDNGFYDTFDDLEIEWNKITEKLKEWKNKVRKNYNDLKKLEFI